MGFTADQQLAIDIRDKNVLVSAAAGAGKTTVLVNRIIKRITDDAAPVDIDRMLIMTFTNAAALEMRERILKAIEKKRDENPLDTNLYRQSLLVHNAHITTIHGFCKSIISEHYESVNVDPNFRIGDENECTLLKKDVVGEILEEAYLEAKEDFLKCVECFCGSKSDKELEKLILKIYDFAESDPNPKAWLIRAVSMYEMPDEKAFVSHPATIEYTKRTKKALELSLGAANKLLDYVSEEPDLAKYENAVRDDLSYIEKVVALSNENDAYTALYGAPLYSPVRLSTIRAQSDDLELKKAYFKKCRDNYQRPLKSLAKDYALSPKENVEVLKRCSVQVKALTKLVSDFADRYDAKKKEKNIIDFGDMEHLAIRILTENEHIAAQYRDYFEEIYVDEYQDSNLTQERLLELICKDEENYGNLFMVGDVKQSIYRFRQARPDLFLAKYLRYATDEGANKRIVLSDNFRSGTCVVDSVNELFEAVMTKENGEIEYDDKARLRAGYEYPKEGMMSEEKYRSEILLANSVDELSDMEIEAHMIAVKTAEIIKDYKVWDRDLDAYRPAKYSDIAILVRGLKGWDKVLSDVLASHDIPVNVAATTGYFSSVEVTTALAFISVVDNPLQDIELTTLLRSKVCDFSDEELVLLKLESKEDKKASLYVHLKALSLKAGEPDAKPLYVKCREVTQLIDEYRQFAIYNPVHEVLKRFIDEIYGSYVKVMYNGMEKMANLNMLLKKAEDYGRTSYKGLFHFVRYIRQIRKYDVDFGEAVLSDENNNSISVMTIHKSKGLEFPICFVAGLTKQRNAMDERDTVMLSARYGIGVDDVDLYRRVKRKSFAKEVIKNELYRDTLEEEMRVLYVALTRAKEKLIVTGICNEESLFTKCKEDLQSWNCFADLFTYAYQKTGILKHFDETVLSTEYVTKASTVDAIDDEGRYDKLRCAVWSQESVDIDTVKWSEISDRLNYRYPYREREGIFYKMSVSDLKKMKLSASIEEERAQSEASHDTYELFQSSGAGAFYGTAFHRLLELWDYKNAPEEINEDTVRDFVEDMCDKHMIDAKQKEAINIADLLAFLKSDLAGRMKKSALKNYLYREQPFVIGIGSEEIYKMQFPGMADTTKDDVKYDDNLCMIQGIIDAFFVEDNHIVIVDYKTDKVRNKEELVRKYKIQLDYYAKALSKLTDLPVAQKIIYSSRLKREIVL